MSAVDPSSEQSSSQKGLLPASLCSKDAPAGGSLLGTVWQHLRIARTRFDPLASIIRLLSQNGDGIAFSFSGSIEIKRLNKSTCQESLPLRDDAEERITTIRRIESEIAELKQRLTKTG